MTARDVRAAAVQEEESRPRGDSKSAVFWKRPQHTSLMDTRATFLVSFISIFLYSAIHSRPKIYNKQSIGSSFCAIYIGEKKVEKRRKVDDDVPLNVNRVMIF